MAGGATIHTVAIPWLHVIREHPAFLEKYANLLHRSRKTQRITDYLRSTCRGLVKHASQVIRCVQSNGRALFYSNRITKKVDYLFVSHVLSLSQSAQPCDFYFGDVPDKLAAQGFSVAIALINHTGHRGSLFVTQWKESDVPRVILSHSLPLCDEVRLYQRLRKESNRLKAEAMRQSSSLEHMVYLRSAEEALSSGTLGAMRVASQIGHLVAHTYAKTVVLTHEGHAWERAVIATARRVNPSVRCIGYQHAAVFRLQHALRRNLSSEYNPDQIVTAGIAGKKQLEGSPRLEKIPIRVLGSNRTICPKTEKPSLKKPIPKQRRKEYVCLVLPEGIPSECNNLFNFSIACSKALPNIRFIWRLHPIVDFQKLCYDNWQLRILPAGIRISGESLDNDLAQSNMVLYRGSTAAVQAVAAGLRPIYLQLKNEMSIDPMHEMQKHITYVKDVSGFSKAVNGSTHSKSLKEKRSRLNVQRYSRTFFTKFKVATLARIHSGAYDLDIRH